MGKAANGHMDFNPGIVEYCGRELNVNYLANTGQLRHPQNFFDNRTEILVVLRNVPGPDPYDDKPAIVFEALTAEELAAEICGSEAAIPRVYALARDKLHIFAQRGVFLGD